MTSSLRRPAPTHFRNLDFLSKCLMIIALLTCLAVAGCDEDKSADNAWQPPAQPSPGLDVTTWGLLTAPVYGQYESGHQVAAAPVSSADKLGSPAPGVSTGGRIINPGGVFYPGMVQTFDGKYRIASNDDSANTGSCLLSITDSGTAQVISGIYVAFASGSCSNLGLQVSGSGPYILLASKSAKENAVFEISPDGVIAVGEQEFVTGEAFNPAMTGNRTAATSAASVNGYAGAELFAGPNKFGAYYAGVLPNGRIVKPAGIITQVGMNPLGVVLTGDGKYIITSNNDESDAEFESYQNSTNLGAYSLTVVDTSSMKVVSNVSAVAASGSTQAASGTSLFIGLQVTGTGPYTLWASGGADNDVKIFSITAQGVISSTPTAKIHINPITPANQGYVSNYTPASAFTSGTNFTGYPWGFNPTAGAQMTFPAGSALSRDGKFLYVACNTDNSIAVIDTTTQTVVKQVAVGYFPYGVSLNGDGETVTVSNWGVMEYKFVTSTYDGNASAPKLTSIAPAPNNQPDGYYVPVTDTSGDNPKTSSVSILNAPGGDGSKLSLVKSVYQGHTLDELHNVGDTHPSATAFLDNGANELLYVTKSNSDALGVINLANNQKLDDIDLSPLRVSGITGNAVHGAYPNAIAISSDKNRMFVAEAGINSVAVLDLANPLKPRLLGRIPTGWYPTALTVSGDGRFLYIANAKGIGEDINPLIDTTALPSLPTGIGSDPDTDTHSMFGTLQQVDLNSINLSDYDVLANNYSVQSSMDTSVVPIGGQPSARIKHVFYILLENKSFDAIMGGMNDYLAG